MRVLFTAMLAVCLLGVVGCGKPKIDGQYRLTKMCFLGKWVEMGEKRNVEMTIKDGMLTSSEGLFGEKTAEATHIKTDSSKNPATIDMMEKKEDKGEVIRGIYKLEGDELTMVFGLKDRDKEEGRPKDFTANEDVLILVLKRK